MSELANLLVSIVTNAGGQITYPELLAQVPAEDRRNIPRAKKEAKAANALHEQVEFADGVNTHWVRLGEKPVPTPE